MNATSKEDRDQWIEAIRRAIPNSPQLHRKDQSATEARKPEEKPAKEASSSFSSGSTTLPPPPSYTSRQDTACDAAVAAASCTSSKQEQEEVEKVGWSFHMAVHGKEVEEEGREGGHIRLSVCYIGYIRSWGVFMKIRARAAGTELGLGYSC